jgi:hypothetical protein
MCIRYVQYYEIILDGALDDSVNFGEMESTHLLTMCVFNILRKLQEKDSPSTHPIFYSGTTFAGAPEMVDCANRPGTIFEICRGLQVWVLGNTVTEQLIDSLLSGTATVPTVDSSALFENFANGTCNVIVGAPLLIFEQRVRDVNYTG